MSFCAVARAEKLSHAMEEHFPELVQWAYHNAGKATKSNCGFVCARMWSIEEALPSTSPKYSRLAKGIAELEFGTHQWGSVKELAGSLGTVQAGSGHVEVGWQMGNKWMRIVGPVAPASSPPPPCTAWRVGIVPKGEKVGSTFFEEAFAPENAWYLDGCGTGEIVGQLTPAENPEEPGRNCGDNGTEISGWSKQEWIWNRCYEGNNKGGEVYAWTKAQAFYVPLVFGVVRPWEGQKLEGEFAYNVGTLSGEEASLATLEKELRRLLEEEGGLREWVTEILPLVTVSPEEEFGIGAEPKSKTDCREGDPVNCATGNEVESQTDLSVGGRGPGLALTRTYNSQQAVASVEHGPFGYGWTGPYGARITTSSLYGYTVVTIHQQDGSAVRFVDLTGVWEPLGDGLVHGKLVQEHEEYVYTLVGQTVLRFAEGTGLLASITDRNGNAVTMHRNSEGRLESVSDASGRSLSFTYNGSGEVESAKDPMGHVVKYAYESGNLASVTLPGESGAHWKFKYNGSHEMTSETDGRGHTTTTEYDGSYRVIAQTDPTERKRKWEYLEIATGSETTITEPSGAKTVEVFNSEGQLASVTRASGTSIAATTLYEYDGNGDLIAVTDPDKHKTTYGYNEATGDRTSETDPLSHETKWKYDSTHDIETETTPEGETITIKRNSHGDPETIERPVGGETQKTTYKYASNGDVESMTSPLEQTWKYEYDSYGDRKSETDPEGNKRTWEYNEDSQEIATVSPRGNVGGGEPAVYTTMIERDAQGRPLTVTGPPREAAYGFAFGSKGSGNGQFEFPTLEAVAPSGDIWVSDSSLERLQEFNEKGEYQAQFGTKGTGVKEFKFPFGIAINPSNGNIYVSDYENYRVQELSSSGAFIRMFGYGVSNGKAEFEICTEKCEAGLKGTGTSGQFGRPVGVAIDASGNVWVADEVDNRLDEFKENGEFIKEFGAEGKEAGKIKQPVGLAYDNGNLYVTEAANQRVQEFSTTGTSVRTFGSEGTGNGQFKIPYAITAGPTSGVLYVTDRENDRVQEFTATGHFLSSFGSKGRGSGQFELPTGVAATASEDLYVSDHNNQRVQEWTGPSPRMTKYAYDANGNLETLTDPNGNKTKYVYDADNELTKTEEPQGTATETEYDSMGRVKSQTDGNKHTTKYEHNLLGEVTEVIDPKERKTTKEYDAAGNLTSMTDAAKRTTTYTYDPADRLEKISYSDGKTHAIEYEYNKDGKLTKMIDGSGTTKYTYDKLDRLTETENGHKEVTKYTYNLANEPTKITYPNGKEVTRAYDKDARLEKVTDWNSQVTKFTYNEDSELKATVFPSETKDEDAYAYNDADQMTEVKMAKSTETLASLVYTHDGDGQVTTVTSKGLPGEEKPFYEYDKNSRLTKSAGTAYEYDAANNPTKLGTTTYKYDSADQLESGGSIKYAYNEVGGRTKTTPETGSATTYGYDQAGNLTSVERPKKAKKPRSKTPTPTTVKDYAPAKPSAAAPTIWLGTTPKRASHSCSATARIISSTAQEVYRSSKSPVEAQSLTSTTTSKAQRAY
jgi:YD repeat-containing protein